jgi:rare lipoprotein A
VLVCQITPVFGPHRVSSLENWPLVTPFSESQVSRLASVSFTHGFMNQKFICGLTVTLLVTTTPLTVLRSLAQSVPPVTPGTEASRPSASPVPQREEPPSQVGEVVKVGEQSPQTSTSAKSETIAKIHSHTMDGRQAATLYVRNIPVLTFVGQAVAASDDVKIGETQSSSGAATDKLKSGALNAWVESAAKPGQSSFANANSAVEKADDPIARSSAIAAKLNQLYRDGVDASSITVSWEAHTKSGQTTQQYVVKANQVALISVDQSAFLPDSTQNSEQDALQVANRLRRLMGGAAPLRDVQNKPRRSVALISAGVSALTGWASWYGPGFHGNATASGEIFNQEAMTAAHRTLPFGTYVNVTNLDNGRSVVVRITDRGPFSGDRMLDLSAGAARVIGLIQSGVAPIKLDVMDRTQNLAGR